MGLFYLFMQMSQLAVVGAAIAFNLSLYVWALFSMRLG